VKDPTGRLVLARPDVRGSSGAFNQVPATYYRRDAPHRATLVRRTSALNGSQWHELPIKLPSDGYEYQPLQRRPGTKLNIGRHHHDTWFQPRPLYLRRLKPVTDFIEATLGRRYDLKIFCTEEDMRIDIRACNRRRQSVCVTFEPGYPDFTHAPLSLFVFLSARATRTRLFRLVARRHIRCWHDTFFGSDYGLISRDSIFYSPDLSPQGPFGRVFEYKCPRA
jgi:hypothetical protein